MTEANLKPHSIRSGGKFALDVMSGAFGMLSYIIFFCLAGITLIVGLDAIDRTPEKSIGLIIAFVSASLFFLLAGWSIRHIVLTPSSLRSKLNTIRWTIVRWWGMLFRAIFISSLGIAGYYIIGWQPIGDIPFSDLTLNQVFKNFFAALTVLGSIFWFLKFPNEKKTITENTYANPYYLWGAFGLIVTSILLMISFFFATLI